MAIVEIEEPYNMCPRFYICSVNHCPLSSLYITQDKLDEDYESICTLPKSYRRRIAKYYDNLVYGGLTKKEFAAEKTWTERSDKDKERIKEQLEKARPGKD